MSSNLSIVLQSLTGKHIEVETPGPIIDGTLADILDDGTLKLEDTDEKKTYWVPGAMLCAVTRVAENQQSRRVLMAKAAHLLQKYLDDHYASEGKAYPPTLYLILKLLLEDEEAMKEALP